MTDVRKIIHVDMDAFYASVEQRDEPSLKGRPVVVGGSPGGRGVVAAASYEARRFGIRSAMSSRQAYRLCPEAVFLKPRFEAYRKVSTEVMAIFYRYTDLVEPLSLDEAYLDVTSNKFEMPFAREIAIEIKKAIVEETGLTASAGVAPNKFLAKVASGFKKPDGLTVIPPEKVESFLQHISLRELPGIGPVTEQKLASMAILTVDHLRRLSEEDLKRAFGKSGSWYYRICRGEDDRGVEAHGVRKSLGAEDTFVRDLTELEDLERELAALAERVASRLAKRGLAGKTVTLKMKYANFERITRSKTFAEPVSSEQDILQTVLQLLRLTEAGPERAVRLMGIQRKRCLSGVVDIRSK